MSDTPIAMALGKVIIAAAWSDGCIQTEEVDCIKDLLFHLPELSTQDLEVLENLLEKPITEAQCTAFIKELIEALDSQQQRAFALFALERVINADGVVTERERALVDRVKEDILASADSQLLERFTRLLHKALSFRLKACHKPLKDDSLENFIQEKLSLMGKQAIAPDLPAEELRKLCLAGMLMARVVWANETISDAEIHSSVLYLEDKWELNAQEALFVTRITLDPSVCQLDIIRMCRQFYERTCMRERVQFLDVLFKIGFADNQLTEKEFSRIMEITAHLKLGQDHFQEALSRVNMIAA